MKKLFIIRHAKSDWSNPFLDDFNRPLNKRGKINAPLMGKKLKDKKVNPDLILSSPAKRALKTANKIAKELNYSKKDIKIDDSIYEANSNTLINIIKSIDDKYNIVFLVGHNPSLNMISYKLIEFDKNIPTTGIVEIDFNSNSWINIDSKNASFVSFDYPKNYI